MGNPAFQPPEPHDWAPHPTHPVQDVPYLLAPLWDEHYAKVSRLRVEKEQSAARASGPTSQIPKNLKEKLKRARGAKTLLQDLEEQVRSFVREWEERQRLTAEGWDIDIEGSDDDIDASGEEEVVFVGRDTRCRRRRLGGDGEARNDKLVFDSPADDQGASFGYVPFCILGRGPRARALLTDRVQTLARPLHCDILQPPYLVRHHRRPGSEGGVRWHPRHPPPPTRPSLAHR